MVWKQNKTKEKKPKTQPHHMINKVHFKSLDYIVKSIYD